MDILCVPEGWLVGAPDADRFPEGWLDGVMKRSKAAHLAASLAFQLMWGSYLAGWMADQRLPGFSRTSSRMARPTRCAILTALAMAFLIIQMQCGIGVQKNRGRW